MTDENEQSPDELEIDKRLKLLRDFLGVTRENESEALIPVASISALFSHLVFTNNAARRYMQKVAAATSEINENLRHEEADRASIDLDLVTRAIAAIAVATEELDRELRKHAVIKLP